jgi:cytochrome c oxidase subunit II
VKSLRAAVALALTGCGASPTYLQGSGYIADRLATLGWVLLAIACAVVVAIAILVPVAVLRRRAPARADRMSSAGGLSWIVIGGIVIPAVILLGTMIYSLRVLAATQRPKAKPAVAVQVIGHRWWWEVRYPGTRPQETFTTANEIHIPVGVPVQLELTTADVIHSFWIPQLAGKTDLIPGQRNVAWIEADTAGRYWGHCGEYCGLQHANMMMAVVAEAPAQFSAWLERQRRPAPAPSAPVALAGRDVFTRKACAMCHTVRGTEASGVLGPDLTHLASRGTIAAGALTNSHGNLAGWVANPQALKPGVLMPPVPLSPDELHALVGYLRDLR